MPYIKQDDYARALETPSAPGELNFAITRKAIEYLVNPEKSDVDFYGQALDLCNGYIEREGLSYTTLNAVIGVLYCAGRELVRRMADNPEADELVQRAVKKLDSIADILYDGVLAPYEDEKIDENGDVYPEEIL